LFTRITDKKWNIQCSAAVDVVRKHVEMKYGLCALREWAENGVQEDGGRNSSF